MCVCGVLSVLDEALGFGEVSLQLVEQTQLIQGEGHQVVIIPDATLTAGQSTLSTVV